MSGLFFGPLEEAIDKAEARVEQQDLRTRASLAALHVQADGKRKAFVEKWASKAAIGAAVAGLGAAALTTWLVWRSKHKGHAHGHAASADASTATPRRKRFPSSGTINLAFTLLGPVLYPLISPLLARAGGLGAFVGSALGIPAMKYDELQTAETVDLARYAGLWHEVARLPTQHEDKCATDATALYVLDDDGYAVTHRCLREDGSEVVAEGRGRRIASAVSSKLEVTFAPAYLRMLPFVWADYWILHVDDDYQIAVVGTVDRDHLWFLTRDPSPTDAQLDVMIAVAVERGFDVSRLKSTPQRG
ncbi:MAG: hypothetical protein JWP52_1972 [Rhizobacter sp.]|nr:hypothetical protein [Rhizobacter sp.]